MTYILGTDGQIIPADTAVAVELDITEATHLFELDEAERASFVRNLAEAVR